MGTFLFFYFAAFIIIWFFIWKPTLIELVSKYKLLIKKYSSILSYSISVFTDSFSALCTFYWPPASCSLVSALHVFKKYCIALGFFILDLFVLLNFSLVFEHLLFVIISTHLKMLKIFYTGFWSGITFFCLGICENQRQKIRRCYAGLIWDRSFSSCWTSSTVC